MHVVLMNHVQIRVAYGDEAASRVMSALQARFFLQGESVYQTDSHSFVASWNDSAHGLSAADIYISLSIEPVSACGSDILPVVSISLLDPTTVGSFNSSSMICREQCVGAHLKPAKFDHKWRATYERDMEVCVELMSRLKAHEASLRRQPVKNMMTNSVLYEEAFLRFEGRPGGPSLGFADCADAIKNIGIQKIVDMYVLNAVIDQLECEPTTSIGSNLSASSFTVDALWSCTINRLEQNPSVAHRLVIELTEEEPIDDLDAALLFIATLKALGCKFALDDLGAGMSRTAVIEHAGFEYIKIDKSLLHGARNNLAGKKILKHTIDYCAFFSRDIIVEGMETSSDLNEVIKLGVAGGQGYYFQVDSQKRNIPVVNLMTRRAAFPFMEMAG